MAVTSPREIIGPPLTLEFRKNRGTVSPEMFVDGERFVFEFEQRSYSLPTLQDAHARRRQLITDRIARRLVIRNNIQVETVSATAGATKTSNRFSPLISLLKIAAISALGFGVAISLINDGLPEAIKQLLLLLFQIGAWLLSVVIGGAFAYQSFDSIRSAIYGIQPSSSALSPNPQALSTRAGGVAWAIISGALAIMMLGGSLGGIVYLLLWSN